MFELFLPSWCRNDGASILSATRAFSATKDRSSLSFVFGVVRVIDALKSPMIRISWSERCISMIDASFSSSFM